MSVQQRVTFGMSMFWIPHVALIHFIYYVLLSPQQHAEQNVFWTLGTSTRVLVGEKTVDAAVKFMWIVHVFEATYTTILARRYETTFLVGVRLLIHWAKKRKKDNWAPGLSAIICACYAPIRETRVGRAFE